MISNRVVHETYSFIYNLSFLKHSHNYEFLVGIKFTRNRWCVNNVTGMYVVWIMFKIWAGDSQEQDLDHTCVSHKYSFECTFV